MKSYECTIFMGSIRHGSEGTHFQDRDVTEEIKYFQSMNTKTKVTVRLTATRFIFMNYSERGFEISAIQYPRFNLTEFEIKDFMVRLGEHLKDHFDQLSLCIMDNETITYLGSEDEHPSY